MAAKIISSELMKAARLSRRRHRHETAGQQTEDQLPPVSTALIDSLFETEWDHRTEKAPKTKAA